jgi:hypothetical protein
MASRGMCMMQMHYFYEISESGLVSRTKGSGWPESRGGLALFTEMPRRVLLGKWASAKYRSRKHRQEEGQDCLYSRLPCY